MDEFWEKKNFKFLDRKLSLQLLALYMWCLYMWCHFLVWVTIWIWVHVI